MNQDGKKENDQDTNDHQMPNDQKLKRIFDLGERTAVLGESVIRLLRTVPVDKITGPLISQLVRCATSIGANYCEGDEAATRKEFRYRINVSRREAKETCFQLRMLVAAYPECREQAKVLWQESKELVKIFASIANRPNRRDDWLHNPALLVIGVLVIVSEIP